MQEKSKVMKDEWAGREMGEVEDGLFMMMALHNKNKTSV